MYFKALHIIFVVTWFAGLFYMPRLLIYNAEAQQKPAAERTVLQAHFMTMMKRLWYGITWPSAVLTLLLGSATLYVQGWWQVLLAPEARWLLIKLFFVLLLYGYHFSLHVLLKQQQRGMFRYTAQQLRWWNEVATLFLVAIVMLAVVKQAISFVWGLIGLVALMLLLAFGIYCYKKRRSVQ